MAGLLKNGVEIPASGWFLEFNVSGAVTVGLLVGLLLGFFNGLMITWLRIPPFVATLAMLSIARGLTRLWTGGFPITGLGEAFGFLGTGFLMGIPMPVWISGGLVGVFLVISRKTRFGRHVYAVGGNERAALLSGLRVNRIKLAVYSLSGLLAAVAGLLATARIDSATPGAGFGYELDCIAAVVIGGTSLSGGRGSILGTALGCLIIGVLNNGLNLLNVSPFWQQVVRGLVILVAVAVDRIHVRRG
jgi:ribose transport system permease protein